MPNGGSDNCGFCRFNKAVQQSGYSLPKSIEFWDLSHCTLRDVNVTNPFWTYCANFSVLGSPSVPSQAVEIEGPVLANGLYEGHVRIPWNDREEPAVKVPCRCTICGRRTPEGIIVVHQERPHGFCTNRHYIEWWKTVHSDPDITADGLKTPEEVYGQEGSSESPS